MQEHSRNGREFKIVEAAKEKERLPWKEQIFDTASKLVLEDLRSLDGLYKYRRSVR